MPDEIETIDKNPKSWAAWKREAERLQAIIDDMVLAAMDSEPVEMPLDYLQGHKDGLEWAAQLAEANHPETGDWLYDDPIELAKAIRKGPDMPPVQPVADSEPVIVVGDDGGDALSYRRLIQSFEPGTKLYLHAQPAPVVEREPIAWLNDAYLARGVVDGEAGSEDAGPGYIPVYREAGPQPAPGVPDDVLDALQKVARIRLDLNDFDGDRRGIADCLCDAEEALIEVVNRRAAMLQTKSLTSINPAPALVSLQKKAKSMTGNSPVIGIDLASGPDRTVEVHYVAPPGYVMVPKEPTAEMISSGIAAHYDRSQIQIHDRPAPGPMECAYVAMLAAAPQEVKGE